MYGDVLNGYETYGDITYGTYHTCTPVPPLILDNWYMILSILTDVQHKCTRHLGDFLGQYNAV
jgi:hypothetical protein